MKITEKLRRMVVVAAVMSVALTSCRKHPGVEPTPEDVTSIRIRLSYAGKTLTRAEGPVMENNAPSVLVQGHIFFTDGAGIIKRHVGIVESVGSGPGSEQVTITDVNGGEAVIENVPVSVKKCYILSNDVASKIDTDGITNDLTGTNISAVQQMQVKASDINDAGGGVTQVPLWGEGNVAVVANPGTTAGGKTYHATASVDVYSQASRIQIKKLTGEPVVIDGRTFTITDFTVEGIYVNYYYPTTNVGSARAAGTPQNNGTLPATYARNGVPYISGGNGYRLSDSYTSPGLAATASVAKPADGKAWAYNLFPTPSATPDAVPHIVIRFSSVSVTDSGTPATPTVLTDQFITVGGMVFTENNSAVGSLERNKVYTFEDIPFDYSYLSPVPELKAFNVLVTVRMVEWKDNPVEPVL